VATIEGLENPDLEVIMTGHYDNISTLPYNWTPGADDNASGTVSLLAAAEVLSNYSFLNTVKFVAFCGEEQGILGSAAYAEEAYNNGDTILGVLNFDMTAYDGNGDGVMEVHCGLPLENQALGGILIDAITTYELDLLPKKMIEDASWGSDHVSFWDYGFTAISGGEDHQDFNPYLHTIEDRVSAFDTAYYVQFTKAAVAGVAVLAHPFILGDANRDRVIDLGDAVYLLGYLFKSQAVPDPLEAGDADCDHMVNLGDVVYLLNYLFKGGPAPGC
jgi:Zn-dependent M28 family amino/carboxypeptidase